MQVLEVKVEPRRLLSPHGVTCVLLVGALVTTVICNGVFTANYNNIKPPSDDDYCLLFAQYYPLHFSVRSAPQIPSFVPDTASNSNCQYAVGGSATVMVLVVLLLAETLSVVICATACME